MTTVLAVQHAHDVEFAWDSRSVLGGQVNELEVPKVWCKNGIVIGFTGYTADMDLVWAMDYPEYHGQDSRTYLITELLPAIKAVFKDEASHDEEDGSYGFQLIIAVDGEVWLTDGKMSPSRYARGVYASGSGAGYAAGGYWASGSVRRALETAAEFDSGTGGTIHTKWLSELIREEPEPKNSEPEISVQPLEDYSSESWWKRVKDYEEWLKRP